MKKKIVKIGAYELRAGHKWLVDWLRFGSAFRLAAMYLSGRVRFERVEFPPECSAVFSRKGGFKA